MLGDVAHGISPNPRIRIRENMQAIDFAPQGQASLRFGIDANIYENWIDVTDMTIRVPKDEFPLGMGPVAVVLIQWLEQVTLDRWGDKQLLL